MANISRFSPILVGIFLIMLIIESEAPNNVSTQRPDVMNNLRCAVTTDDQRSYIMMRCLLNVPAADIHRELVQAIGDNSLSNRWVRQICQEFTSGARSSSSCQARSGRPVTACSDSNTELVQQMIENTDEVNTNEIAANLEISTSSVRRILDSLGYQFMRGRYIPHELTEDLRRRRVQIARSNFRRYRTMGRNGVDFLGRIIAIDETYFIPNTPDNQATSGQWVPEGGSR